MTFQTTLDKQYKDTFDNPGIFAIFLSPLFIKEIEASIKSVINYDHIPILLPNILICESRGPAEWMFLLGLHGVAKAS